MLAAAAAAATAAVVFAGCSFVLSRHILYSRAKGLIIELWIEPYRSIGAHNATSVAGPV